MLKSNRILVILFLDVGFMPISIQLIVYHLGIYLQWSQIYLNEACAWTLIFSVFHFIAFLISLKNFRKSPVFFAITGLVSLIGISWGIGAFDGIWRMSSKMDDINLHLFDFWFFGGWLSLIFVAPIFIIYLIALFLERRSVDKSASSLF